MKKKWLKIQKGSKKAGKWKNNSKKYIELENGRS